ncbi:MAG: glycosyltransferase family 4 protein [Eubacteriales bacterium]|nr:glycosyltransferase family 4 protein [Eubacteriales bacterium]
MERKAGKYCFYLGLFLEILIVILDKSSWINPFEGQMFRITFLLFALKLCLTKYTAREWTAILAAGFLAGICYLCSSRDEAVRAVVFVASMKGIDHRRALKLVFYGTVAGMLALAGLAFAGVLGEVWDAGAGYGMKEGSRRLCLGEGNSNALAILCWAVMTLGIYLYHEKMKRWHYALLAVFSVLVYLGTLTRTALLMMLFTVALAALFTYVPGLRRKAWPYNTGIVLLLFCVAFSVFAAYISDWPPFMPEWVQKINNALTGRIASIYPFENGGGVLENWRLFGDPSYVEYFDMGYVRLFFWYGILPGICCVALLALLMRRFYRNGDDMGFVLTLSFCIFTVVEAHAVSVYLARNYVLFLLGAYWTQMVGGTDTGREVYWWRFWTLFSRKGQDRLRVVMLGADRSVKGGVSAVVNNLYAAGLDKKVRLTYIGTMADGSAARKLWKGGTALLHFLAALPGTDIVHLHMAADASCYRKIIFLRLASLFGKKILVHEHGGDFRGFYNERCSDGQRRFIRRELNRADLFLVLSEEWRRFFAGIVEPSKIRVLENAVPVPEREKQDYGGRQVLFLGRLCREKGIGELLESAELLKKKYPDFRLILGGVWEKGSEKLRRRAEALADTVECPGWVTAKEREELFFRCSIFALPSWFEGQPVSLLEAMAAGMCTVSAAVGGIPQILGEDAAKLPCGWQGNGVLVRQKDAGMLTEALERLLEDGSLREALGKRARRRIREHYGMEKYMARLLDIYRQLAG